MSKEVIDHRLKTVEMVEKLHKTIYNQDQKISDLEAKLAESEKQIKDAREAGNMAVDSWCKNRRKYEAQIAEMQNKSFILYSMLYETLEKQGCENVASQIDQMTGWTYDKETDWLKGNRNYDQLKQQLAEKEKEIEISKSTIDFYKSYYISFKEKVIDELEKVKEEMTYNGNGYCEVRQCSSPHTPNLNFAWFNYVVFNKFIDNQIKAIKEMK